MATGITTSQRFTGPDLAARRVRRGIRAIDVARRIELSRQRVSQIEHLWRVPPDIAARYLQALEELAA